MAPSESRHLRERQGVKALAALIRSESQTPPHTMRNTHTITTSIRKKAGRLIHIREVKTTNHRFYKPVYTYDDRQEEEEYPPKKDVK